MCFVWVTAPSRGEKNISENAGRRTALGMGRRAVFSPRRDSSDEWSFQRSMCRERWTTWKSSANTLENMHIQFSPRSILFPCDFIWEKPGLLFLAVSILGEKRWRHVISYGHGTPQKSSWRNTAQLITPDSTKLFSLQVSLWWQQYISELLVRTERLTFDLVIRSVASGVRGQGWMRCDDEPTQEGRKPAGRWGCHGFCPVSQTTTSERKWFKTVFLPHGFFIK